mgnify:CR=1 FL=1
MHTHAKVLIFPVMALLLLAAGLGIGLASIPSTWPSWSGLALGGAIALLTVALVVVPVLQWRCNTWTLTDRRIIHRSGVVTRTAHDLPLNRINDVESERGLLDRVLGCGTLRLMTAAEAPVLLHDIPDVEKVHVMLSELLFGAADPALGTRTHDPE